MTKSELKEIIKECLSEAGIIEEKVNMFNRINAINFIKGKKFDKKRKSKKALKESYEPTLYSDIPKSDASILVSASDKACKKVYDAWKEKYDNNDEDFLYYEYKGEKVRLDGYDEFFKLHKVAPTGSKLCDFDGYPVLMTGVDADTQYSGVGLDFEAAVSKVILEDNKSISEKYYLSAEDYLGINVEFTEKYYNKIKNK